MQEHALAQSAYAQSKKSVGSPRAIEYQVFARVTRNLKLAAEQNSFPRLAEALHANVELWTIIGADVAHDGNTLPRDLRVNLFKLCEFTRRHSAKVLRGEEKVDALIDVNVAVMKGLRPPAAAPQED